MTMCKLIKLSETFTVETNMVNLQYRKNSDKPAACSCKIAFEKAKG
jgi:hypothetical protein